MEQRFVDVFLKHLKIEGVSTVFGIPGGLLYPFFAALESDPGFQLVVTKHEEGAAFMADGYTRVGGKVAVCAGTSGPGATNLLTGVACAFADGVPMLVVTGQVGSHSFGRGASQETAREDIDIVAIFKPVTKYSAMVTSPNSLPGHLRRAFRSALTGRPGPVHLNVPVDMWEKLVSDDIYAETTPQAYRPTTDIIDSSALQHAADVLLSAERPALLAGSGVRIARGERHLIALAEALPARVATSPRGKSIFPEDHDLALGVCGFAGHHDAREAILEGGADVVVAVGASLNETTTLAWHSGLTKPKLIQVDIDPERIGRSYPVTVGIVGDARVVLEELTTIMKKGTPASTWGLEPPLTRCHDRYMSPLERISPNVPLSPARWRCDFEEALPERAVVFSDIGGHMMWNIHELCFRAGQQFVLNFGFGSMGHGTVAPIGAALADPTRPVFAIVGDACFTMNGMELLTAVDNNIPVIWVVENNNMHCISYHGSKALGGKPLRTAQYNRPIDIAAIARAMGVETSIVTQPGQMQVAVKRALEHRGPYLIEVIASHELPPPMGDRSRSLSGFIGK